MQSSLLCCFFLTPCKCVEFLQLNWSFSTSHPNCPRIPRLSFICALHAAVAAPGESQRAGYNYCRPDYPKSAFPLAAAAAALSCGRCWRCMTRYSRTGVPSAFPLAAAAAAPSCGRCWRCMTRYSRTGVPSVTFSLTIWLFSYQLLLIVPRGDLFICRAEH